MKCMHWPYSMVFPEMVKLRSDKSRTAASFVTTANGARRSCAYRKHGYDFLVPLETGDNPPNVAANDRSYLRVDGEGRQRDSNVLKVPRPTWYSFGARLEKH